MWLAEQGIWGGKREELWGVVLFIDLWEDPARSPLELED